MLLFRLVARLHTLYKRLFIARQTITLTFKLSRDKPIQLKVNKRKHSDRWWWTRGLVYFINISYRQLSSWSSFSFSANTAFNFILLYDAQQRAQNISNGMLSALWFSLQCVRKKRYRLADVHERCLEGNIVGRKSLEFRRENLKEVKRLKLFFDVISK